MPLSKPQKLETYHRMQRIRLFEEAVDKMNESNKLYGVCHLSIGQEAAIVGACMALRDDDYITGTHRSHGHPIGKGASLNALMAELMGKETGICKGRGGSMHLTDSEVGVMGESAIVGGGIPLGAGCGLAARVQGSDRVAVTFFGDGASNQGTFHESINMAGLWKLPVIFFCENNGYAVTTSLANSHSQPDIAKRAQGYDIPGINVDGQDVEAVYAAMETAVARARAGEGPSLIVANTYRFDSHAAGLNEGNSYRSEEEVQGYIDNRDPLALYKAALLAEGIEEAELTDIDNQVAALVAESIAFAEQSPEPEADDVYDCMYSNPINYPPQFAG